MTSTVGTWSRQIRFRSDRARPPLRRPRSHPTPPAAALLLLASLSAAFPGVAAAQVPDSTLAARIAWLRRHAIPIRSIDLADTDFSDLQPILRALRGVRVVLLGEQTHTDGATFDAKARLVRFLHEDARFGYLAFEANQEMLRQSDRRLTGPDSTSAVARALPAMWGESETVRRLLAYARTTRESAFPLHIAGFDIQLAGRRWDVPALYRHTLDRWIGSVAPPLAGSAEAQRVDSVLSFLESGFRDAARWPPPKFAALNHQAYERMLRAIARLRARILATAKDSTGAAAQLLRLLDNLAWGVRYVDQYVHHPEAGWTAVRDRAMADNLLWLARRHSDQGIVAWAHWGHIARNLRVIDPLKSGLVVHDQEPMGEYVSRTLHNGAYAIGFLAYGGAYGQIFADTADIAPIPRPPRGSLDWLLAQVGPPYLFLDLRSVPRDHWLRQALVARPSYKDTKAAWPDVFDGIVFIRTMYPNRRLDTLRGR